MNLLAELHTEHDLKLNLKFEIEVLCKALTLELSELSPGTLLKDYDKLNKFLNNFGLTKPGTSASGGAQLGASGGPSKGIEASFAGKNFYDYLSSKLVSPTQAHFSMVLSRNEHLPSGSRWCLQARYPLSYPSLQRRWRHYQRK